MKNFLNPLQYLQNKTLRNMLHHLECKIPSFFIFLVIPLIHAGCSEKKTMPPIGNNVARPIDLVAESAGSFFYVLNSTASGLYRDGSIMVLDNKGDFIKSYPVQRMGRFMLQAGSDLVVGYDHEAKDLKRVGKVELYSIDGKELTLQKTFSLEDCSPLGGALRENYPYFAVSCQNGRLFVGELKSSRKESTLDTVRYYPNYSRKAWYIDPKRELLLGFVTDLGKPSFSDNIFDDKRKWQSSEKNFIEDAADDVPDFLQEFLSSRVRLAAGGSAYQYVMLDLAKLKSEKTSEHFTFKEFADVQEEMRWLYFNLSNQKNEPDQTLPQGQKFYRTNIYAAKPSTDPDCFYFSHRGVPEHDNFSANNIVKACFVSGGEPRPSSDGQVPTTDSILTFKRAYGFNDGQLDDRKNHYLGDFSLLSFTQGEAVIVNGIRDFVYFKDEGYFLGISTLDFPSANWTRSLKSSKTRDSYFQVAALKDSADGSFAILTAAYYDDSLRLLKVEYGGDISNIKTIR